MGTFGGHALPGSFFVVFALWWTVQTFRRYFRSQRPGNPAYRSTVTFVPDFLSCTNLQLEGILKVCFTALGLILEVITAFKDGHFTHIGNGQHATMFFFFGLSGIVDILLYHKAPLPEDTDYAASCLSFVVEDLLFMFHLHGRSELDVLLHTLLLYVVHACVLVVLVEMRYRNSPLVTLSRSFLVLLQGTWFWQVGFILYNPNPKSIPWKQNDHREMMLATMMFAWHAAVDFILILIIGLIVKLSTPLCCLSDLNMRKDLNHSTKKYNQVKVMSDENEGKKLQISDSDSEIEFSSSKLAQV